MNKKRTKVELLAELEQAQKRIAELESATKGENAERFANTFRISSTQMALTDFVTGKYIEVNDAFLRILGFERSEVIGKTALELNLFYNPAQRAELLQRMATQGCLRDEYVLVRAKTGDLQHGIFSAEYVYVNGQKLILTMMNDVTERVKAEERWQFALECAGDGVWDRNVPARTVFYSSQWKSMLGYADDEIANTQDEWEKRVHPDDLPDVFEKVNRHFAGQIPQYNHEYRMLCKDGSYKWVLDRGKVVEWTDDHRPLRIIGTHKDISERKAAEENLRASEKYHRMLVETLDVCLCRWLPDTTLTFANEKYKKIFGVQGEAVGKKWITYLPEEAHASTAAFYRDLADNPRTVLYEHPVTVDDGSVHEYQWIDTPIIDEQGLVLEFQSVGLDITDRKHAAQALNESEELHRLTLSYISDAVFITDSTGAFTFVCPNVNVLFGYQQPEVVKMKHISGLFGKPLFDPAELEQKGEIPNIECTIVDKYGQEHALLVTVKRISLKGGTILYTCHDISERQQAEQALRESEERFRSFMEHSADGFMLTDEQGVIIEWNQALSQITGLSREQALEMTMWELQTQLTASQKRAGLNIEQLKRTMTETLRSGQSPFLGKINETDIQTLAGDRKFIQQTSFLVPASQGNRIGAVIRDITERKRMERELEAETVRRRILFEESPDGILVIDPQTAGFLEFNMKAHSQLGYSREEFAKLHIFDVEVQETAEETRKHIGEVIQNGKSDFETLQRTRQGEIRNIHVTAQIVEILGKPVYYCTWRDITERKQAEEKLRESERRFATIFRDSPIGQAIIRFGDNQFLDINQAWTKLWGFERKEVLGKTALELGLWAEPSQRNQLLSALSATGDVKKFETEFYCKSRELRRVSVSVRSVELDGEICLLFQTIDITARKQAEEKLRESEERFRALFESSNAIMLLIEPDSGQIVNANLAAASFYGYPREQLVSMNINDINQLPSEQVLDERQRAKREERNYFIFPHRLADGQIRTVEVRSHPITSSKQVLLFSIVYDVTESIQNQKKLHESQLRMEMALKGANVATWDWNVKTGVTVFNDRWAEIVGYSLPELEPISIQTWANLCHPDDLKISNELLHKHFTGESEYYECEARMKHKNGSWIWVIDRGKVLEWDTDGQPLRMFGTHLDITERKREERFIEARLRLANLSHETPDMDTLIRLMLDEAEALTGSAIGFFHFVDDDQNTISLQAWSTNTINTMCTAEGKGQHYPVTQAGVWADGIRNGEARIYNDYSALPNHRELPHGHAPVTRLISLPIKRGNLIVAAIGVGNKPQDYDQHDLEIVQRLADEAFDIILRKRAEQALRESERKLSTLLANLIGFAYRCQNDHDWTMEYVSGGCEPITGYSPGDLIENRVLAYNDIIHPADQEHVWVTIQNALSARVPFQIEYRINTRAGIERWVWEQGRGIFEGETLQALEGFITDITDRKRAEQGLHASEEEYRKLSIELDEHVKERTAELEAIRQRLELATQTAKLGVWDWKVKTGELFWDEQVYAIYGLSKETFQVSMESFLATVYPEDVAKLVQFSQAALSNQLAGQVEYRIMRGDGMLGYVKVHGAIRCDNDGQPESVIGVVQDITSEKLAEKSLRESEERYRKAISAAGAVPYNLDYRTNTYTFIGEGIEKITGYGREELTPILFDQIIEQTSMQGDLSQWSTEAATRLVRTGESAALQATWRSDFRIRKKNGDLSWLSDSSVQILDRQGKPDGAIGILQDISERKRAEEALRHANIELARAMRMKDEFLTNMSHELRTPLNGILGLSEALQLQTYGTLSEKQLRAIKNIESSGRHLLSLINDILDLSKIEAGKLEIHVEPVSVADLCQASLSFVKEPAIKKGVVVGFVSNPLVTTVLADVRRLKQILINLLSNAVKFTPPGGKVTLEVQANVPQHMVNFSVSDTGIGIAPEDLARLFNPFTQVDSSLTRQHEGSGLGLALVKELAEMHGGCVRVSSEVGQGSTFTVSIPWQPESDAQEMFSANEQTGTRTTSTQKPLKPLETILLAEDVELNIMTIGDFLESQGFNMIYAQNGREAIEKTRENVPALILMDIQMPVMDGLEAIRQLRADPQFATLPIIALTAMAMSGDSERCLAAGANAYVSKPVGLKQLVETIRALLNKNNLSGTNEVAPV